MESREEGMGDPLSGGIGVGIERSDDKAVALKCMIVETFDNGIHLLEISNSRNI